MIYRLAKLGFFGGCPNRAVAGADANRCADLPASPDDIDPVVTSVVLARNVQVRARQLFALSRAVDEVRYWMQVDAAIYVPIAASFQRRELRRQLKSRCFARGLGGWTVWRLRSVIGDVVEALRLEFWQRNDDSNSNADEPITSTRAIVSLHSET